MSERRDTSQSQREFTPPVDEAAPHEVHALDPLADARWDGFVARHPRSSVFHSSPWLKALRKTYGYTAVAYTTSKPAAELDNAILFCRVESWLTGRRLVSLPFSDHCEPLMDRHEDLEAVMGFLEREIQREKWRYVEVRPVNNMNIGTNLHVTTTCYAFHEIELGAGIETLFRNLHKDSIQRKIARAERERLRYEEGRSDVLLDDFYRLLTFARRRHRLPPQPKSWFRNLVNCFGDSLKIRVARRDGRPLAGMITIRHKDTMVYKYGGSDRRYHNLGSMHLLYWTAIQEAKSAGLRFFDFGRTDADQPGLITFKKRWGSRQSVLVYSRFSASEKSSHVFDLSTAAPRFKAARQVVAYIPNPILSALGRAFYKHVG